jgi:hypothetical protein
MFTVGTITDVDEPTMSCTIKPEDGGEVVKNVPIRVMRYANQIGFSVVPRVGTEVIVMWLDEYRPTIFQIHEWEKVVVKNKSDVGMVVQGNEIWVGEVDFGLNIKPKTGPVTVGNSGYGLNVATPVGPVTLNASPGNPGGFGVKLTGQEVEIGTPGSGTEPAVKGNKLVNGYIEDGNTGLHKWLKSHTHSGVAVDAQYQNNLPEIPDGLTSNEVKIS